MIQQCLFDCIEIPQAGGTDKPPRKKQTVRRRRRKHGAKQRELFEQSRREKSQRMRIIEALKTPMTINELYRALPDISPKNIAPLVTGLYHRDMVNKIGLKMDTTEQGIQREQVIWSSLPEHLQAARVADSIVILSRCFGVKTVAPQDAMRMAGRVANDE